MHCSIVPQKSAVRYLGVIMSEDLKVRKHCTGICRRSFYKLRQFNLAFSCRDTDFQLDTFKTYVRPLLEYNTPIWSPHLISDIDLIERVQRWFTKRLPGLWNESYAQRLQTLDLESLEVRRIKNDLILLFKIVKHLIDLNSEDFFTFNWNHTRGHSCKINIGYSRLNCRKYFFSIGLLQFGMHFLKVPLIQLLLKPLEITLTQWI